jgi:hypothetical protein
MPRTEARTEVREVDVHRKTVTSTISDIAAFLQEMLGRSLIAYMTESDVKTVTRWAKGENTPRPETEKRLRLIYTIVQLLQTADSPHVVRAWLIGMNPQLEDEAPATAIQRGGSRDVLIAAKAYVAGG